MPEPIIDLFEINKNKEESNAFSSAVEKARPCRIAFIDEKDKNKDLPVYRLVKRGVVDNVMFLFVSPSPCILVISTKIKFVKSCHYEKEELEYNYLIKEYCGVTQKPRLYAYPKEVWDELFNFYIKPLVSNETIFNTGVILMGPPGTGKSRLAKIAANYAGVNLFSIDSTIKSKYVGQTENNLKNIISEARKSQPAIIIIDDAEWLLSSRALASNELDPLASLNNSLKQILFDKMQEIYDNKEKVLFIATTNVKEDVLDPALVRHGRFGPPLFVPLPDFEAAKIIVKDILNELKDDKEIESIALTAVNAGLSVADIIALAEKVRRGGESKPKTTGGRGYIRIYIDRIEEFRDIEEKRKIPLSLILNKNSRLSIIGEEDIAAAFAIQLAYSSKKTAIKLVDTRYLNEAINSANMLKSVFIVPSRLPKEIIYHIIDNIKTSVIFVGPTYPPIRTLAFKTINIIQTIGIEAAVKAVLAYKHIKAEKDLINMIKRKVSGDYTKVEKILASIVVTGIAKKEYIEHILAWM